MIQYNHNQYHNHNQYRNHNNQNYNNNNQNFCTVSIIPSFLKLSCSMS